MHRRYEYTFQVKQGNQRCSLKFLLFHLIGNTKRCLQKNTENVLWPNFCDMTVPSKSNV